MEGRAGKLPAIGQSEKVCAQRIAGKRAQIQIVVRRNFFMKHYPMVQSHAEFKFPKAGADTKRSAPQVLPRHNASVLRHDRNLLLIFRQVR
jgi:hypothetical protein